MVNTLSKSQRELVLQCIKDKISSYGEKESEKIMENAVVVEENGSMQRPNSKTVPQQKRTVLKAGTVKPCFLRLVPLSRAQTVGASSTESQYNPTRVVKRTMETTATMEEEDEAVDDPDFCEKDCYSVDNDDDIEFELFKEPKVSRRKNGANGSRNTSKVFICEKCGKSFCQKTGLDVHLKRHNGVKQFSCALCKYNAVCKIEILRHMSKHTGERKYSCEFCKKLFTSDCSLRNHIRHIHIRSEKLACNQCPFQTHSKDILKKHFLIKHTVKEQYVCPVCHEIIKQKGSFMVHMRKHTGERPYHCTVCPKSFKSSSQLSAHTRTHRPGEYSCTFCSRPFKTKHQLDRHKIIHTGEKPYQCHLCTYSCNVKANITKHMKVVHKIFSFSFKQPPLISNNPDALERGHRAADEYLKEHTLKAGEVLTLEDLKRQSREHRDSLQEAKLEAMRKVKPNLKKQFDPPVSFATSDVCVNKELNGCDNIEHTITIPMSECVVDTCSSDILSDAVQLLNSPIHDNSLVEHDGQLKTAMEHLNAPTEIGSNVFIIQVVSDQNLTNDC